MFLRKCGCVLGILVLIKYLGINGKYNASESKEGSENRAILPPKLLSKYCYAFVDKTYSFMCRGEVSTDIKLRYKDQRVSEGTPFTIYVAKDVFNYLFLTFHDSPLSIRCREFQYTREKEFKCMEGENLEKPSIISLNFSHCFCFSIQLNYVIEHADICSPQLGGEYYQYNEYMAIHYTRPKSQARSFRRSENKRILQSFAILLAMWSKMKE